MKSLGLSYPVAQLSEIGRTEAGEVRIEKAMDPFKTCSTHLPSPHGAFPPLVILEFYTEENMLPLSIQESETLC